MCVLMTITGCNIPDVPTTETTSYYRNETPRLTVWDDFKVIPADNPNIEGYQPWLFTGREITTWLKEQSLNVGSRPLLSPWLDNSYFVLDYDNAVRAISEFKKGTQYKFPYIADARDCDDYAFAFKSWLQFMLSSDYSHVEAAASVSVIFVKQKLPFGGVAGGPNVSHALVALGTNKGVVILEPQTGEYCLLERYPNKGEIYYLIR